MESNIYYFSDKCQYLSNSEAEQVQVMSVSLIVESLVSKSYILANSMTAYVELQIKTAWLQMVVRYGLHYQELSRDGWLTRAAYF